MDMPTPRVAVDDNKRMNLRLQPEQKATLMRAAALRHTDLTDFVLQPALREAKAVIEEFERVALSERDSFLGRIVSHFSLIAFPTASLP